MIEFERISFRNFLSYGNAPTTFEFNRPGTTLIVGENQDNTSEGVGSNGVGKTTLFQALVYALWDRVLDPDLTKDDIVNNINKSQMEVSLEFKVPNGTQYKIVRHRKMKPGAEGNKVFLYEDGKDISRSVDETNAKIEEVTGWTYDMFVRIVVFPATQTPFLKLPTSSTTSLNQRQFIEDLFGLSIISVKAERLKDKIKVTKQELELKKAHVEAKKAEQARHLQHIARAEQRAASWVEQQKLTIANNKKKLALLEGIDIEQQKVAHNKIRALQTKLQSLVNTKSALTKDLKNAAQAVIKLDNELVKLLDSKCPHCEQPYDKAKQEADTTKAKLHECEKTVSEINTDTQLISESIRVIQESIEKLQKDITVDDLESLIKLQSDADNIRKRCDELEVEVNPFLEEIHELKNMKMDVVDMSEVNALQKTLDHQNFLLKLMTKNDSFVRKSLLNKYLPFLNGQLKQHLTSLGLPYVVEFQHDLIPKITKHGTEMKFSNLSNGQRARVNFGFSIAFKDVRERLHGRANICVFDEVLDYGLDSVGVIACAKLIKQIARQEGLSVYVVSHRNEIESMFDRKLTVTMNNGFSGIVETTNTP